MDTAPPVRMAEPVRGDVFAALASPVRRDLMRLLLERGPQPVQDLAASFDMQRPSVSEHLRVLREAGLVSERRRGRHRYYQLEPAPLAEIRDWLDPYERFWRDRLAGLVDLLDRRERATPPGEPRVPAGGPREPAGPSTGQAADDREQQP